MLVNCLTCLTSVSLCVKWKEWKSRFVVDMEMCCPDLFLGSTCGPATGTAFRICLSCRNDSPPQYSCLENPMDGGAWQATVHGVAKSQTRLTTEFPHLRPHPFPSGLHPVTEQCVCRLYKGQPFGPIRDNFHCFTECHGFTESLLQIPYQVGWGFARLV